MSVIKFWSKWSDDSGGVLPTASFFIKCSFILKYVLGLLLSKEINCFDRHCKYDLNFSRKLSIILLNPRGKQPLHIILSKLLSVCSYWKYFHALAVELTQGIAISTLNLFLRTMPTHKNQPLEAIWLHPFYDIKTLLN